MTLKGISLTLATTALLELGLPAMAQDRTGVNLGATAEGAAPGGAATMGLAHDLYALGVAQGDAVTVLAAAKLAASVDVEEKTPAKLDMTADEISAFALSRTTLPPRGRALSGDAAVSLGSSAADPSAGDAGAADAPVTADGMFVKARELAADDDALLGLIRDAMAETSRGRIGGAVEWLSRLPSGQTDVWEIPYYGNSYAEVAIVGDGDANLDVAVTDENGNVICSDVSWSDKLYCNWTPAWDGYFYVTVRNMGGSRNSYYLMTN